MKALIEGLHHNRTSTQRCLPRYKKEDNARDYIDSYQLYAGKPGGLTIQANKGKEDSGQAEDSQFQGRKNHIQMGRKEKADQHQERRNKCRNLNGRTGGNRQTTLMPS